MTRILIVDDDPGLRELLVTVLDEEDYVAQAAEDGHLALAVLPTFTPDLIITDLQMPTMSGWELVTRARQVQPGLSVLIISASTNLPPPHGMGLPPRTRFVAKSFRLEELLDCVWQLTRGTT